MQLFSKTSFFRVYACVFCLWVVASCTTVKEYRPGKAFVYSNKIVLTGASLSKDDKKRLESELDKYWDDSMRVVKLKKFGVKTIIKNPPTYDSINVLRSLKFMNAYLNSQGYYYANLKDSTPIKVDTFKDQLRAKVVVKIDVGKNVTIDSAAYAFVDTLHQTPKDTALQQLAMQQFKNSLLVKGKPYNKQVISNELDNLVTWFRQNGYYKFSRDYIYALVDTTNEQLFKLTLDPLELAKLIADAEKKKKENPMWDVVIKQRAAKDTGYLTKYFIGHSYFYPETDVRDYPDSLIKQRWADSITNKRGDLTIRDKKGLFKLRPLREHTFLRKDSMYNENLFLKTINTLSKIPAWQQIDARIVERDNDTLDVHYFLVPQKKYVTNYNITTSRNSGDFTAGNLLGLSVNATLNNRNVWKQAIQSSTSLGAGVELNLGKNVSTGASSEDLIQTLQFSLSHSYSFPRLILPFKSMNKLFRKTENKRTLISASAGYTERIQTFKLKSLNLNYGWEWQKGKATWYWKPANIELYNIDTLPGLDSIFQKNPFLRNSFIAGNVIGFGVGSFGYSITKNSTKHPGNSNTLRLGFDESGLFATPFKSLDNKVYKFLKFEVDYKFNKKLPKAEVAYHFFAGLGVPLAGQSLPFFKQYFAGGPNSMRAWGLRQLGLGSSKLSDTIPITEFRDRFGDMQLEANIEYRFLLANIGSFKISSALYADIGNVWNLKKNLLDPNAEFSISRLPKDIAVGVGTGLRLDFTYFLVRVDFAYKVKDPGRDENNGWMSIKNFKWKENRANVGQTEVRNYAFQLGIGLPF